VALDYVGIDRSGRREVWRAPSWDDVLRAIGLLDGRDVTMLTLSASEETYLTIAGGSEGLYLAGAALASGRFAALVDPARAGGKVAAVLARASREVASEMGVDRETVLRAARRFYLSATLDPALTWVFSKTP
jgi:hypothetical protein